MDRDTPTTTRNARAILELPECRGVTAVERMAHRWYLEPASPEEGRPDVLLAPRFARVPALRIDLPTDDTAYEVHVAGWCPYGWFSHLRVSCPGAAFPVTVTDPRFSGRPGYEEKMRKAGRAQLWRAYALTVPAGTPYIEISKGEEVEAELVSVTFRPCAELRGPAERTSPHRDPMVIGLVDMGILASETLQAYDRELVRDFYAQTAAMGFSHIYRQIYAGSAPWSEVARAWRPAEYGHLPCANWDEPARCAIFTGGDHRADIQHDIGDIHAAGMQMVASFRINNEWMAAWAREMLKTGDQIPDAASVFSVEHEEFWATWKSGGRSGGGLDFAFPEVREYRLQIIEEWCDKFRDFDGVCIDLHRHPPMITYPEHLVQEFHAETGIDVRTVEPIDEDTMIPEWHAFRARPFTEFMRMVRTALRHRYGDDVFLTARVGNTFDQAMYEGADLRAWIEEDLVDQLVLQHRDPANPLAADTRPVIEAAHAKGIAVVHLFGANHGVDFQSDDLAPVRPLIENWRQSGSDGFGFYEAERIVRDGRWLRETPDIVEGWS